MVNRLEYTLFRLVHEYMPQHISLIMQYSFQSRRVWVVSDRGWGGDEREPVSAVKGNQVRDEIKREIMEST